MTDSHAAAPHANVGRHRPPHVAEHFDDAEQQLEAMQLGMWAFLATEVLFFGAVFFGYSEYRRLYSAAFAEGSSHLSVVIGTFNTAVLLGSSLAIAFAVRSAQINQSRTAAKCMLATLLLGSVFLGVKAYEYYDKWDHGLIPGPYFQLHEIQTPGVNPDHVELFFSLYFVMTGLHALHMIIGSGVLIVLIVKAWRGVYGPQHYAPVENMALYWHFVDIVWVFLFPLLYLIR